MTDTPGPPPPPERIQAYSASGDSLDSPTPSQVTPAGYASQFTDDETRDPASPGYVAPKKTVPDRTRLLFIGIGVVAVVAIVLIVVMVANFLAAPSTPEADSDPVAAPTTAPSTPGAPSADPTPSTEGGNDTEFTYSGTGNKTISVTLPDGGGELAVADITHRGERNFYVTANDAEGKTIGGIATGQGDYTGTVVLNALFDLETSSLDISADGRWTITIRSIDTLETSTAPFSGSGDAVFRYEGPGGTASSTYDGESNFIVWSYGTNKQLVENEIGTFTGSADLQPGPAIIAVVARGDWTISVK